MPASRAVRWRWRGRVRWRRGERQSLGLRWWPRRAAPDDGMLDEGAGDSAQGLFQAPRMPPLPWARTPGRPGSPRYVPGAAGYAQSPLGAPTSPERGTSPSPRLCSTLLLCPALMIDLAGEGLQRGAQHLHPALPQGPALWTERRRANPRRCQSASCTRRAPQAPSQSGAARDFWESARARCEGPPAPASEATRVHALWTVGGASGQQKGVAGKRSAFSGRK